MHEIHENDSVDQLDINKVQHFLPKMLQSKVDIAFFPCIDSTNEYAKKLANFQLNQLKIIVADQQTAGKGKLNRSWFSPAGENLYLSLVFQPDFQLDDLGRIPLFCSLAVHDAVLEYCGLDAQIKWPNDLLFDGKKFCGILVESIIEKNKLVRLIIGIGINVNTSKFPDEIENRATSLRAECLHLFSREGLCAKIISLLENYIHRAAISGEQKNMLSRYVEKCMLIGKKVRLIQFQGEKEGIAIGVDELGRLKLIDLTGRIASYSSGEVSILIE